MNNYQTLISICGGGVRCLMSAYIIKELEYALQKERGLDARLVDYIFCMGGNSGGGILSGLYLLKNESDKPKYSAADVFDIYVDLIGTNTRSMFSDKIDELFGQHTLVDLYRPCLIPAYEPERRWLCFFKQHLGSIPYCNFYLRDVMKATSAIPVFSKSVYAKSFADGSISAEAMVDLDALSNSEKEGFISVLKQEAIVNDQNYIIADVSQDMQLSKDLFSSQAQKYLSQLYRLLDRMKNRDYRFIDGCIFCNDPALPVYIEYNNIIYQRQLTASNVQLLSFVSGEERQVMPYSEEVTHQFQGKILQMTFYGSEKLNYFQTRYIFERLIKDSDYVRFNPVLTSGSELPSTSIFDTSKKNMDRLIDVAKAFVDDNVDVIERVVQRL